MSEQRYANTDPSLHYNAARPRKHGPIWQSVWIYLLKIGDEDAAQLVRDQNAAHSHECHYGDRDLCHYPHCECVCHRAATLKLEHPKLRSLSEIASEESEAA